jgi:hypothetical protein
MPDNSEAKITMADALTPTHTQPRFSKLPKGIVSAYIPAIFPPETVLILLRATRF